MEIKANGAIHFTITQGKLSVMFCLYIEYPEKYPYNSMNPYKATWNNDSFWKNKKRMEHIPLN
jgi:hypothetical protein